MGKNGKKQVETNCNPIAVSSIANIHIGGTPKRINKDYWDGDIKWITAKDISECNSRYITNSTEKITEEGLKKSAAKLFNKDTIVITARGTVGAICLLGDAMAFNQTCYGLIVKNGIITHFLYYALKNSLNQIRALSYGTVFDTITTKTFDSIKIRLPTLNEQKRISSILSSIDDKIENLQSGNKNLERIVRSIFKSWFIDFDGQTKFMDSELGEIPSGWEVKRIEEVCETFGGGTPSTKNIEYWGGKINWAVPSDLTKNDKLFLNKTERRITEIGLKNCASRLHPSNSILMTSRASIGFFAINRVPLATNQGFIVIQPRRETERYYLLNNFQNRVPEFINNANGTTFLEISRGVFRKLPIFLPSKDLLVSFHKLVNPLYEDMFFNERTIEVLISIRDNLLPKLMSGDIIV